MNTALLFVTVLTVGAAIMVLIAYYLDICLLDYDRRQKRVGHGFDATDLSHHLHKVRLDPSATIHKRRPPDAERARFVRPITQLAYFRQKGNESEHLEEHPQV